MTFTNYYQLGTLYGINYYAWFQCWFLVLYLLLLSLKLYSENNSQNINILCVSTCTAAPRSARIMQHRHPSPPFYWRPIQIIPSLSSDPDEYSTRRFQTWFTHVQLSYPVHYFIQVPTCFFYQTNTRWYTGWLPTAYSNVSLTLLRICRSLSLQWDRLKHTGTV